MWEDFSMCKFEPVLLLDQVLVEMSEKTEMSFIGQAFQALKCLFFWRCNVDQCLILPLNWFILWLTLFL